MRKTRTALQADERWLHESSFSLSFCLTVLVYQPVRLAADGVTVLATLVIRSQKSRSLLAFITLLTHERP